MPFIPASNVIQAELVYTWDGQIVQNVLHYQSPVAVTVPVMQELGAALVSWWTTNMRPNVAATVSLTEVRLTDLTSEFAAGVTFTTGLPVAGSAASASLPNNVSLSMTKRTALRGRSYRGRVYQVGITESSVTDNLVSPSVQVLFRDAWVAALAFTVSVGPLVMVVVSRFEGGLPRATALVTEVEAITTDGIIDSQRRRLPGRGN